MSVGTMSKVFEYDMPNLETDDGRTVPDSTAKFVLLALADHASDEGEGAYPGVKRICKKTSMSSQTVCNALNALRHNGYTTKLDEKSKAGTNNYTINLSKLSQPLGFQPLESADSSHKNPTIPATRIKPSINHQGKPSLIINAALELFKGYFGKFNSRKELDRWVILYEAAGPDRAEELLSWASKKEIELTNRPGLLDSLETAAKNWQDKPARSNGNLSAQAGGKKQVPTSASNAEIIRKVAQNAR